MLPNDLDRMYEDSLLRIENQSEDYRELAEKVLAWITYAVRPLLVAELQEALAVEEAPRNSTKVTSLTLNFSLPCAQALWSSIKPAA